jgi:hypothetical protein
MSEFLGTEGKVQAKSSLALLIKANSEICNLLRVQPLESVMIAILL